MQKKQPVRRRGLNQQWIAAVIAIAFTAGLVFWIVTNRPDPPRFDDMRISTIETPPPPPRGPRLMLVIDGRRRVNSLDSPSFSVEPGKTLAPGLSPGPFNATLIVPIRIDEPIEASIHVEFADCTVEVIHNETSLGTGESSQGPSAITTERLPFPTGTFDFHVRVASTGDSPRCSVSWIVDEEAGPVPIPSRG